jgi:hypothetical protein
MFAGSRQREATMDDALPGQAFRRVPDGYDPDAVDDRVRELQRAVEAARARQGIAERVAEALRAQSAQQASNGTGADPDVSHDKGLAARIEHLLRLAEQQAADLLNAAEQEARQLLAWAECGQSPDDWAQERGELRAQLEAELRPQVRAQLETELRAGQGPARSADGGTGGWFSRRRAARSPGRTAR